MSGWPRLGLWWRHKVQAQRVPARRLPELVALAVVVVVVLVTLATTTEGDGWSEIAQRQAVNIASAAMIGGFGYLLFVLRFRRGELKDYLELCASRPDRVFPTATALQWRGGQDEAVVANCVVEDIVGSENPRSHLLISDVDAGRRRLLVRIVSKLAEKNVVPVVLELRGTPSAPIASLARDRFVTQLVGAAGDPRNAGRLFSFLVQRRRLVVLVDGLERVAEAKPARARRAQVSQLLSECLVERIVFVATVEELLAPHLSEVSALRTGRMSAEELTDFYTEELGREGISSPGLRNAVSSQFHTTEPTRDPAYLRLAVRLVRHETRGGVPPETAVQTVFADPCAFRRHLRWMCRWALNCDLHEVRQSESPEATALRALGLEAHYTQVAGVDVESACDGMEAAERRRVLAGLARLVERRIVDIATVDGDELARFTHPGWLAFAGAVAAARGDASVWSELVSHEAPSATLDALTASLLLDESPGGGTRSLVKTMRALGITAPDDASLDLVRAVVTALQADSTPLIVGDEEVAWITRAWEDAGEPMRLRFITDVDFGRHPRLVAFLWAQVVPPQFAVNSWRLRRAICRRLSALGSTSWTVLGADWEELVEAGREADLSTVGRDGPGWERCGAAIASLSWVLPTLLLRLDDDCRPRAEHLLSELATVVGQPRPGRSPETALPDIGLAVSLAEGFKVAAGDEGTAEPQSVPDRWREEAMSLFTSARSWLSRLVLLQTLGVTQEPDHGGTPVTELLDRVARDDREHPFVREAAALLRRGGDMSGVVGKEAWLDDPETLDDGGLDLAPAAHRLLGLSTLLVNLAENVLWQARQGRPWPVPTAASPLSLDDGSRLREKALSGHELPRCFTRRSHAATMFDRPCDCEFSLCGPEALGPVGFRRLSRAFVQRSETVCAAPPASGSRVDPPFALGAFRWSWRLLDQELSRADRRVALDR